MDSIVIIRNANKNIALIEARYCVSFIARLRGFTFRKQLALNEGLILVEKRDTRVDTAIHMLFVWTDLAVFWINSNMEVVDKTLAKNWRPFYASRYPAQYVLEIHPNLIDAIAIGDQIVFEHA